MSHSIYSVDRATHFKIVVAALSADFSAAFVDHYDVEILA